MKIEQCDFKTALKIAAGLAGIGTTQNTPQTQRQRARALERRRHDASEHKRADHSSEAKYRILATVAHKYRPHAPVWLPLLDHLLDIWLKSVPMWTDVRSLSMSIENMTETGLCVQRLFREWRAYYEFFE